jgi:hypothetical protein
MRANSMTRPCTLERRPECGDIESLPLDHWDHWDHKDLLYVILLTTDWISPSSRCRIHPPTYVRRLHSLDEPPRVQICPYPQWEGVVTSDM